MPLGLKWVNGGHVLLCTRASKDCERVGRFWEFLCSQRLILTCASCVENFVYLVAKVLLKRRVKICQDRILT